jgi:O-antigen/teichoic acid export membrane protein
MNQTERIIRNAAVTYGQSLFALLVSLFTARWILEGLGEIDMGLLGLVGALIALMAFLNGGLAISTSRFYAYSIGQAEKTQSAGMNHDLKEWFNSALSLYIILPVAFVAIGFPLGEYLINHRLNIPADRLDASNIVFRLSLFNLFVQLITIPFLAMYTARQRFGSLAIFGTVRSFLTLIIAFFVLHINSDRLIMFSVCMVAADASLAIIQAARAAYIFPECRPSLRLMYRREKLSRFFAYSGWKLFGASCLAFRTQGSPMVINLMFGPAMNAAYSIAYRLSLQANKLSESLSKVFSPGIFAAEGRGDRAKMLVMSTQICRYSCLLVLLFSIPIIIEAESIFIIWLKNPPAYCAEICQYLLVILIGERITSGPMLAINAYGKIAAYEIVQGIMFLLALPLIWFFARNGVGPSAIGLALLVSGLLQFIARLVFCRILLGYSITGWLRQVFLPLVIVTAPSYILGDLVTRYVASGFDRILLTSSIVVTCLLSLSFFVVLSRSERTKFLQWASRRLGRDVTTSSANQERDLKHRKPTSHIRH